VPHVQNLFQAIEVGPKGSYPMDWTKLIAQKARLRRHILWHLRRPDQQQKQRSVVHLVFVPFWSRNVNSCNFYSHRLRCWFLWLIQFIGIRFFMGQYTRASQMKTLNITMKTLNITIKFNGNILPW